MEKFSLLGSVALQLHQEFVRLYYLFLPVFFMLAIVLDWVQNPGGSADFLDTLKRAFIATLLVAGFQEISDTILAVTTAVADRISDMNGWDVFFQMAQEKAKSYTSSTSLLILGFNDLVIALLSYASYVVVYIARYVTVATYHFMWIFLSILSPLLILMTLFRGTSQITIYLFKSLIEVACWRIVWAVMSVMITSLGFGNAYAADGDYLTVILLNFVIALAMLGTQMIVSSLVGKGLAGAGQTLSAGAALVVLSASGKAVAAANAYDRAKPVFDMMMQKGQAAFAPKPSQSGITAADLAGSTRPAPHYPPITPPPPKNRK